MPSYRSIEHIRQKQVAHLPHLLRLQRLEVLNWSQWPEQVCLVGASCIYTLCFAKSFTKRARFVRIGKLATEAEGRAFPPTIAKAHVKLLRSSFPGSGGFSADGCPD